MKVLQSMCNQHMHSYQKNIDFLLNLSGQIQTGLLTTNNRGKGYVYYQRSRMIISSNLVMCFLGIGIKFVSEQRKLSNKVDGKCLFSDQMLCVIMLLMEMIGIHLRSTSIVTLHSQA